VTYHAMDGPKDTYRMVTCIYLIEKLTSVTEEPNEWGKLGV